MRIWMPPCTLRRNHAGPFGRHGKGVILTIHQFSRHSQSLGSGKARSQQFSMRLIPIFLGFDSCWLAISVAFGFPVCGAGLRHGGIG